MKIFEILLIFYVHIVLHEMCHVVFFMVQGLSISKIYIFPIEINFSTKTTYKLKVERKYCGMVIPRLKKFDSKTRLKCEIAIIAPSCIHLIFGIVSLILLSGNQSDFWLLVATINFFMLLQGFYENNSVNGDVQGVIKIWENYYNYIFFLTFVFINDSEINMDFYNFLNGELEKLLENDDIRNKREEIQKSLIEVNKKKNSVFF